MKNKTELWCSIGAILICLGILMSVGIMLYECFTTSIPLFIFMFGLIIAIMGTAIGAINDE